VRRARVCAALLAAAALGAACGEPPPPAPVEPRAAWLLESPQLRVGDVATLERLVVTPPGFGVSPLAPGSPPAGFWLLDAEALPTEKQASRWLHRTQLRLRAREVGRFGWPATRVAIEAPGGAQRELELAGLALEVVSVLPEAADQLTPYGVQPLPVAPASSLLAAAAAGAGAALGALALLLLVVRRRRARSLAPAAPAARASAGDRALASLTQARAQLAGAPVQAADAIAATLRRFVEERFGVPALARTREELAALHAPLALATRWTGFVTLLGALDHARFAPEPDAAGESSLLELVAAAEAFVGGSLPPAAPR
jgi:hypothetical protein